MTSLDVQVRTLGTSNLVKLIPPSGIKLKNILR